MTKIGNLVRRNLTSIFWQWVLLEFLDDGLFFFNSIASTELQLCCKIFAVSQVQLHFTFFNPGNIAVDLFVRFIGVMVKACALLLVSLGFISQAESYQKTLINCIHNFPTWSSAQRIVCRTSRSTCFLCLWARHLTACRHLLVTDRWLGQAVYPSWWPSLTKV